MLAGTLLLLAASSFLVTLSMDDVVDQASRTAAQVVIDLEDLEGGTDVDLTRYRRSLRPEHPEASLSLVPTVGAARGRPRSSGPWRHRQGAPPTEMPSWLSPGSTFSGLVRFETTGGPHLVARALQPLRGRSYRAVIVDLPIGPEMREEVLATTGVDMGVMETATVDALPGVLTWVSFLEHTDWTTGQTEFLNLQTMVDPRTVYQRLLGAQTQVGTGGVGLFLVIEVTALVMGLALARSITGAVHELFVGTEHVRKGDFGHRIVVGTRDQLGELADSFNAMTGSVKNLLQEAAEKKRLEEELRIARRMQMSLLPRDTTTIAGVTVSATSLPAREVGGDYYEFIPLGDRQLGILVADVSGKGTSAAFYMAELKGVILALSQTHLSPKQLLIEVNRIMAPHIDDGSFITMMYVILDLERNLLTYARAGHTPLIYVRGDADVPKAEVLAPGGLVVGLNGFHPQFDELIEEDSLPVGRGDVAVLFTDGITEAMNDVSDLFGEERLRQLVESHAALSAPSLREQILDAVKAFVGDADQHDDMTLVLLKVDDLDAEVT